jgi:hypothetical protein
VENGNKENIRIQRPFVRAAFAGKLCAKFIFFVVVLMELEGDGDGFARLGKLFEELEFEEIHCWMVVHWVGFRGYHGLRSGGGGDGDEVMVVSDGDEVTDGGRRMIDQNIFWSEGPCHLHTRHAAPTTNIERGSRTCHRPLLA